MKASSIGILAIGVVIGLAIGLLGSTTALTQPPTQNVRTVTQYFTAISTATHIAPLETINDKFRLGAAQPNTPDFIVWHIAKERGLFQKYLPNVELIEFAGGTGELVRALADGTVQVGWGLTEGIILGVAAGAKIGIVSTIVETPLRWVIVVKPDSPYQKIQDLKGKTIATSRPGGGSYIVTVKVLTQLGWQEGRDFFVNPIGDLSAMISGVKGGSLDAMTFSKAVLTPLIENGELRVLAEVPYEWAEFSLAATHDFARNNAKAVKAVVNVLREAMKIFNEEKQYSINLLKAKFRMSDAAAEEFYTFIRHSLDGVIFLKHLDKAQDFLIEGKALESSKRIQPMAAVIENFAPIKP